MSEIHVTFESLQAMQTRVQQEGMEIGDRLRGLLAEVRALVGDAWRGQAAVGFETYFSTAHEGWREIETALAGVAQTLGDISTAYSEQETYIFNRLTGG